MSNLFPETPDLEEYVPMALATGTSGFDKVVGRHHETLEDMPASVRPYAALLFLAHKGYLKDKRGKIVFTLTPTELAAWYHKAVGEKPAPNELKASIEALQKQGLVQFYDRRECRVTGDEANTYRFAHHVFPVGVLDR